MKKNINDIKAMKQRGEKIVMITAYDYAIARIASKTDIDMILVGDSLGMVVLGYENTLPVTMADMFRHTGAVVRSRPECLIVGDMPYQSYENKEQAVKNAKLFIEEAGADAVKIEGNKPDIIQAILQEGIPVMGHTGLTPQTVTDFKVQGKDKQSASRILKDAVELERAGCFSIILECVPRDLAKQITAELAIPTIGIGAGPDCDGQVLISNDVLGLFEKFTPRFVKQYANLSAEIECAFVQYKDEVKKGIFPSDKHSYH
ncbi:3-methyl-2-oxobutanoate hydroxymethyltransferase [bacterium]|nr:3-methyl-2-oxobutanoate hydroxymethyltransferase [bacterium]